MNLFVPAWLIILIVVATPFVVSAAVNAADNSSFMHGLAGGLAFLITAAALWPATLVWYFLR